MKRLVSLDFFRGLTIAGMIIVNDPGSWSHVYAPLLHAEWHGATPTDLVFPFFLFIVGICIIVRFWESNNLYYRREFNFNSVANIGFNVDGKNISFSALITETAMSAITNSFEG